MTRNLLRVLATRVADVWNAPQRIADQQRRIERLQRIVDALDDDVEALGDVEHVSQMDIDDAVDGLRSDLTDDMEHHINDDHVDNDDFEDVKGAVQELQANRVAVEEFNRYAAIVREVADRIDAAGVPALS